MEKEPKIMEILRDKRLQKELEQVSALMQEHLLVILARVYQSGIEEGIRLSQVTDTRPHKGEVS